jgi:hypothetical protein
LILILFVLSLFFLLIGVWDSLNGINNNQSNEQVENFIQNNHEDNQYLDANNEEPNFTSFGNRNNRNNIKGRGFNNRNGKGGRGRGLDMDQRGKDWTCPSCSNLNWSWRSNCNVCNTAKPLPILVSYLLIFIDG